MTLEKWQAVHPGGNEYDAEWFYCLPEETQYELCHAMLATIVENFMECYAWDWITKDPQFCVDCADFDLDESGNMIEKEDEEE